VLKSEDSPLIEVNIGLLADNVGVTTSNTLDLGQGVHDLPLSINVGVEETEDVLELHVGFGDDERHVGLLKSKGREVSWGVLDGVVKGLGGLERRLAESSSRLGCTSLVSPRDSISPCISL
jgi:hypothetical protein